MLASNHHYYNYHLYPTVPIQSLVLSMALMRSLIKFSWLTFIGHLLQSGHCGMHGYQYMHRLMLTYCQSLCLDDKSKARDGNSVTEVLGT